MENIRVLLPDGGGTQALPIARSLHKKGHEVHLFYRNKYTYGSHTRYAKRKIQAPAVSDEQVYLEYLEDYIREHAIDVLIPMSDPTAELISRHRDRLSLICKVNAPDYETFMRGYDKNLLMHIFKETPGQPVWVRLGHGRNVIYQTRRHPLSLSPLWGLPFHRQSTA